MAEFSIQFDELILDPPTYDESTQYQLVVCGADAMPRVLGWWPDTAFTTDYVLGYNLIVNYPPIVTVRLHSYSDEMYWIEIGPNTETPVPGFTPSLLKDDATGNFLVYPYNKLLVDIAEISTSPNSTELMCNSDTAKYRTERRRTIEYSLIDNNGLEGPIRKANLITYDQV